MAIGTGFKSMFGKDDSDTSTQAQDFGSKEYYDGFTPDTEAQGGGPRKMSRLDAPVTASISGETPEGRKSIDASGGVITDADVSVGKQIEMEADSAIKYRTCSWQMTAALLFSEYICLAIMSFPYSYSVLGLGPGIILTIVQAAFVLYTSIVVWEFCLRHPEVKDVCDVGQVLLWNKRWAWWFTGVMFVLNNTFIQGFHCLVGAKYLNTMTQGTSYRICTVGFSGIMALVSWVVSMPRTFSALSKLATGSAFFTFVSVILATIFAGIEDHPGGATAATYWPAGGRNLIVSAIPVVGTPFIDGMNAFLNISYTFIGQITLPSFIAEMKDPKDFPKALWAVTIAEIVVFSVVGAVIYAYTGTQYNVAPAFGSLGNELYLKVSFSFMIPTLIFLGVLYASVTARFVFFRLFRGTRHITNHTWQGWLGWAGILGVTWVLAFIIAEVIPFFSYLLSLMSSLFDSFFGWIYWGIAYFRMRNADYGPGQWHKRGWRGWWGAALNVFIIAFGLFTLTAGTYATAKEIELGYESSSFGGAFSCASNGLVTHG